MFKPSSVNSSNQLFFNMLVWAGIACLLVGFLYNRVVINCGFLLIGIYFIIRRARMGTILRHPWMWTFIGLAVLPLISDMLLEGRGFLQHRGVMKLLLILLPVFIFSWRPQRREIKAFHFAFIGIMLYATAYSLFIYFTNYQETIADYRVSKVMKVLAMGDHIRISWAIVIACLIACYEYSKTAIGWLKLLLVIYILGQIAFLHVLTSKMGLIILYLTTVVLVISVIKRSSKWIALLIVPMMALLPYLSFKFIPSFEQRLRYMKYDWEHYSEGRFLDGLSDAVRFFSLKAGGEMIEEAPYIGHGFSRLQGKMNQWYATNLPEMGKDSYFLPSSEIVIYWASGGLLGLLVFLAHMFVPFFMPRLRQSIWFIAFFIPAIISFGIETHLEGQIPLWLYGWFCAWFWWIAEGAEDQ